MPANEPLTPAGEHLIGDLASQAGLVLRNVRLIEELRASRQRLVAAQDEERRRLERNIHDGAQQQLVALGIQLGLAQRLAQQESAKVSELLGQLQTQSTEALDNLRDLARGIYPPLLADQGLAAALVAQARKAPIPVTVQTEGVGRYPQDVEAARTSALWRRCRTRASTGAGPRPGSRSQLTAAPSSSEWRMTGRGSTQRRFVRVLASRTCATAWRL
jgi:hypothetical protein